MRGMRPAASVNQLRLPLDELRALTEVLVHASHEERLQLPARAAAHGLQDLAALADDDLLLRIAIHHRNQSILDRIPIAAQQIERRGIDRGAGTLHARYRGHIATPEQRAWQIDLR